MGSPRPEPAHAMSPTLEVSLPLVRYRRATIAQAVSALRPGYHPAERISPAQHSLRKCQRGHAASHTSSPGRARQPRHWQSVGLRV
ncbi:hypothetical protein K523DRAFT_158228 [Schizophyllum commune Tattone D]|nr:hypothetical protein K523DRAFT_158228 [Schizophyllum commune Tattone D]